MFTCILVDFCSRQFWFGGKRTTDLTTCEYSWTPDSLRVVPIDSPGLLDTMWNPGEPNCKPTGGGRNEACMSAVEDKNLYEWLDVDCEMNGCPFCELDVGLP